MHRQLLLTLEAILAPSLGEIYGRIAYEQKGKYSVAQRGLYRYYQGCSLVENVVTSELVESIILDARVYSRGFFCRSCLDKLHDYRSYLLIYAPSVKVCCNCGSLLSYVLSGEWEGIELQEFKYRKLRLDDPLDCYRALTLIRAAYQKGNIIEVAKILFSGFPFDFVV